VVCEVIGGKVGGKGSLQGAGQHADKIDEAVAKATQWIKDLKI